MEEIHSIVITPYKILEKENGIVLMLSSKRETKKNRWRGSS